MSQTHGSQGRTTAGGVLLVASSVLAAILVIAGLSYATGTGGRHQAALAAAGCEPGLSPSGLPCTTTQVLASQYKAIMTLANQQMKAYVAAYTANERHHLATAEAALTAEVTTENAFDASLAGIHFPPAIAPIAKALIQDDQARAKLIAEQARSSSLTQLGSFNHRVRVASAAVQTEMNLILKAVDSPPQAAEAPPTPGPAIRLSRRS
jgi:hypothetical protein